MSFEERVYQLLDAQEISLKNKRITMNHRLSKIKDKHAALDAIDYKPERRIDKAQIQSLSQLNFINAKQNVIVTGKTGTGKSFLAQALANRAIYDGIKVYYVRTPTLLEEIRISRIDGTYTNLLNKYSRFKLLILDDFGVSPWWMMMLPICLKSLKTEPISIQRLLRLNFLSLSGITT
jgi:DNA replication protein DnaC